MKNKCKDITLLLEDYTAGELPANKMKQVESHLVDCTKCREEVALIQRLNFDSLQIEHDCETMIASIDWEETAQTISESIPFKTMSKAKKSWLPGFDVNWNAITLNWKFALPAMAAIFLIGLWLGYLIFNRPANLPQTYFASQNVITDQTPINRLENTLARKEVAGYFNQTELVLMDLMKQCSSDGTFSIHDQVDVKRVQELLSRSRYFKDSLDNPKLLSSKELMKKIEWLLYEILMSGKDDDASCQRLQKLQKYIKDERLLIKMHMVGKELSLSEV